MGSEKRKKAREKFLLDRFLEHQGMAPASIETPEPPGPDFSIELDGYKVGIELTEVFAQSPESGARLQSPNLPQAIESRSELIVSIAKKAYFQRNNPLGNNCLFQPEFNPKENAGRRGCSFNCV
jgi:hypothetical protein